MKDLMLSNSVSVDRISKSWAEKKALDSVSFEVGEAELFGFIGPDGAGKTTLFRILATLLLPDEGKLSVLGMDVVRDFRKLRSLLGYMPGRFSLYQDLTVYQNLKFYATIYGTTIEENFDIIRDIYSQIAPFSDRLAGKLSGGMKQKLALCCALIHRPSLLLLDEPTTGVDAISRVELWQILKRLKSEGMTIIVSTPYMDEAALCDRVALIQGGRIMALDQPGKISRLFSGRLWSATSKHLYPLLQELKDLPGVEQVYLFGQSVHFTTAVSGYDAESAKIKLAHHVALEIQQISPEIEDVFISLMSDRP